MDVHEDVPPPSLLAPGIPAYVDALFARATARDLDQRPADAGVLLQQVHRVAHALRDGVREDDELTRDLALRTHTSRLQDPEGGSDTKPDTFDVEVFARLVPAEIAAPAQASGHGIMAHTTALDRRPVAPPPHVP